MTMEVDSGMPTATMLREHMNQENVRSHRRMDADVDGPTPPKLSILTDERRTTSSNSASEFL